MCDPEYDFEFSEEFVEKVVRVIEGQPTDYDPEFMAILMQGGDVARNALRERIIFLEKKRSGGQD